MINKPSDIPHASSEAAGRFRYECTPEQHKIKKSAVEFAKKELTDDVVQRDQEGVFNREFWRKCAEYGIFSMGLPGGYGDIEGLDFENLVQFIEGLGYGCRDNGFVFAVSAQILTIEHTIAKFGSNKQRSMFLPKLCSGEWIGAEALTEPDSGSDVFNMRTKAEKCEGGYRLSGSKCLVTLAPIADMFLVYATTNSDLGKWGLTTFVVERSWSGVVAHPANAKMGLRTVPIGEVSFEGCFIPETHRIGREGAGFSICSVSLELERCGILAGQLGSMERQLEETISYAKETHRFGKPIGSFQSVSNRIVDMKLRLETGPD